MSFFSNPIRDLELSLGGLRTNFCFGKGRMDQSGVVNNRNDAIEHIAKARKKGRTVEAAALVRKQMDEPVEIQRAVFFRASASESFADAQAAATATAQSTPRDPEDDAIEAGMNERWQVLLYELLQQCGAA
ncbi:MAG: hypothetical protein HKN91_07465 [Acidimicrobiia bacterium]|nr:hypothetical protein [Acidimicrobiia bacterium]